MAFYQLEIHQNCEKTIKEFSVRFLRFEEHFAAIKNTLYTNPKAQDCSVLDQNTGLWTISFFDPFEKNYVDFFYLIYSPESILEPGKVLIIDIVCRA